MPSTTLKGYASSLKYGTAGGTASSVVGIARDVTINGTTVMADDRVRSNGIWTSEAVTGLQLGLEFEIKKDNSDPAFTAIRTAYLAGGSIALRATDPAGHGLEADFQISDFTETQELAGVVLIRVSARNNNALRNPITVAP